MHGPDAYLYCTCPIYAFSLLFSLTYFSLSHFYISLPPGLIPSPEHFIASCLFSQYCGKFYTIPKCSFSLHPIISPIPLKAITFSFQGVFLEEFWLILVGFTLGEHGLIDSRGSSWFTCSIFALEDIGVDLLFCFWSLLDLFLFNQIT